MLRVFQNKTRSCNNVLLENQNPKDLTSVFISRFPCALCNESYDGECARHLNAVVKMLVCHDLVKWKLSAQTAPESIMCYHRNVVLFYNLSESYDNFSIITRESKTVLLEVKENSLAMSGKPSLNKNFSYVNTIVPIQ